MVKGILIRVGADKSNLGVLGPIFDDGTFEFIPINEKKVTEPDERRYSKMKGRYGGTLADYIPKTFRDRIPHNDPEFITPSYGDPTTKKRSLKKLEKDDYLFFNAGLRAHNTKKYPERANYIVGYFTVDRIVDFSEIKNKEIYSKEWNLLQNNFHVGYRKERDTFVVVGQKNKSALLSKAIRISELKPKSNGDLASKLTRKMEKILDIEGFVERGVRKIPESGCRKIMQLIEENL